MKHARGLMEIMYCRNYVNVPVCVCVSLLNIARLSSIAVHCPDVF